MCRSSVGRWSTWWEARPVMMLALSLRHRSRQPSSAVLKSVGTRREMALGQSSVADECCSPAMPDTLADLVSSASEASSEVMIKMSADQPRLCSTD
eukprot:scaffold13971_cov69-Phaeocystis_antarctica.AAC.5